MRPRLLAVAALLALAFTAFTAVPAGAKPRAAKRLKAFGSCQRLVGYAARHVPPAPVRRDLPPFSPENPAAAMPMPVSAEGDAGAGEDTSQTNVQEAGVDEPDTVKTDGKTIFALANGSLHAVSARSDSPQLLGTLELDGWGATMLLHGNRMLVLGGGPLGARMTEVDISDPARMKVLRTEDVDGYVVGARLTDRTARVVVVVLPRGDLRVARAAREAVRLAADLEARGRAHRREGHVARRRLPLGPAPVGLQRRRRADRLHGRFRTRACRPWTPTRSSRAPTPSTPRRRPCTSRRSAGTTGAFTSANTSIHRFDTSDPDRTAYSASGAVPGTLLNQFAMSEDKGVLRAATTLGFGPEAQSKVTTLGRRDGHLVQRGQVGGLGLGERIYAVRFIGDVGYVVTFRQTDPLYTLDLSDPDNPRVVGELKIPGYSAYLHPVGEELLLGVGQEATSDGRVQGLQLSLFDVSDLAHPTRLQKAQIGARWSSSAVEWDHHAFLWWPTTKLAVLPIDSEDFTGAAGFRVDRARGISELGRVTHDNLGGRWTPSISRAVVVGPRLFTVSDLGIKASGLESFAGAGWAAFPQPPEQPVPIDGGPVPSPRPRPAGR